MAEFCLADCPAIDYVVMGEGEETIVALIDALDHAGLGRNAEKLQMPATSGRVWQALQAVKR